MSDPRLPIDRIDLEQLGDALDDHGSFECYFDPSTGETVPDFDAAEVGEDAVIDVEGMVYVAPMPSRDAYAEMSRFAESVGDRAMQRRLLRALEGKGAFRRFRDEVWSDPDLSQLWRRFEQHGQQRRALQWLMLHDLVDPDEAERAIASRRAEENAILGLVAGSAGFTVDADDVSRRWPDIVGRVEAGESVEVTRDGDRWATIEPNAPTDRR